MKDGHGARARAVVSAQAGGRDLERTPVRRRDLEPLLEWFPRSQHLAEHVAKSCVAHHFEQWSAFRNSRWRADDTCERVVAERDAHLVVHRQYAFHHGGENSLAARRFQAQPVERAPQLRRHAI